MNPRVHRSRVTHDRWLVSYADFITLLFAFFVVLYAFAKADQKKQSQVSVAIDSAFQSLSVLPADIGSVANWPRAGSGTTQSAKAARELVWCGDGRTGGFNRKSCVRP